MSHLVQPRSECPYPEGASRTAKYKFQSNKDTGDDGLPIKMFKAGVNNLGSTNPFAEYGRKKAEPHHCQPDLEKGKSFELKELSRYQVSSTSRTRLCLLEYLKLFINNVERVGSSAPAWWRFCESTQSEGHISGRPSFRRPEQAKMDILVNQLSARNWRQLAKGILESLRQANFLSLPQPIFEYFSHVWSPYYDPLSSRIETTQRFVFDLHCLPADRYNIFSYP